MSKFVNKISLFLLNISIKVIGRDRVIKNQVSKDLKTLNPLIKDKTIIKKYYFEKFKAVTLVLMVGVLIIMMALVKTNINNKPKLEIAKSNYNSHDKTYDMYIKAPT